MTKPILDLQKQTFCITALEELQRKINQSGEKYGDIFNISVDELSMVKESVKNYYHVSSEFENLRRMIVDVEKKIIQTLNKR